LDFFLLFPEQEQKKNRKKNKKSMKQKRKLYQETEETKKIKFEKIVFGNSFVFGLDKYNDLYKFNEQENKHVKHYVKNIFGYGDHIVGINYHVYDDAFGLDNCLFQIINDQVLSTHYFPIGLQLEKLFGFSGIIFGNTIYDNTWIFSDIKDESLPLTQEKCLCHLKKVIQRSFTKENQVHHIFIGIDYNGQFCIFYGENEVCSMEFLQKEQMIKLLSDQFKEQEINDIIKELLNEEEKEFTIDCSGKKMDVKMIHKTPNFSAAVDGNGNVYFSGKDKFKFMKTDSKPDEWTETPYLIGAKSKIREKRRQKLCHLLQK
jgi:hypothetical protein